MKIRYFDGFKRHILGVTVGSWLCLVTLSFSADATDYATKFPKTEALISEGGHWITAGTPGVNWHDTMCGAGGDMHVSSVSTTEGYAFGPTGSKRFGDSLALLTGNWGPDQMAEATVRQIKPFGYPEVEIRLRTSPKDATGYEIMWSALGKKRIPYLQIATWDGPGSKAPHYTYLKRLKGPKYGVSTGDVVKAVIIGHTISAYTNGKLQFTVTDSTFSTGNPGFGFNEGPAGTYGISRFSATDVIPHSTKKPVLRPSYWPRRRRSRRVFDHNAEFYVHQREVFCRWSVADVGDHAPRLLPQAAFGPWDADFVVRSFRKRNFCRRGTFQPNSQRKTLTVDQYHPLRSLAALAFPTASPPFRRGEAAIQNVSPPSARPLRPVRPTGHATFQPHAFVRPLLQPPPRDTRREETATSLALQNPQNPLKTGPGSRPRVVPACPSCAVVRATTAQSVPTVHPSSASVASS